MANFTKQAIKESFLKLLNEQPLSQISVRDIVEDCGINRNSFYYHFQDIPTLIGEIVKEEVDRVIAQYPTISSLEECVNLAFGFALRNKKAVMHIYHSVNRDIYEKGMMKMCEYVVSTYLDTAFAPGTVSEYDRNLTVLFFKCEIFGLSFEWIENGMKDDAIADIQHITELCRGLSDELIRRSQNAKSENQ